MPEIVTLSMTSPSVFVDHTSHHPGFLRLSKIQLSLTDIESLLSRRIPDPPLPVRVILCNSTL